MKNKLIEDGPNDAGPVLEQIGNEFKQVLGGITVEIDDGHGNNIATEQDHIDIRKRFMGYIRRNNTPSKFCALVHRRINEEITSNLIDD